MKSSKVCTYFTCKSSIYFSKPIRASSSILYKCTCTCWWINVRLLRLLLLLLLLQMRLVSKKWYLWRAREKRGIRSFEQLTRSSTRSPTHAASSESQAASFICATRSTRSVCLSLVHLYILYIYKLRQPQVLYLRTPKSLQLILLRRHVLRRLILLWSPIIGF